MSLLVSRGYHQQVIIMISSVFLEVVIDLCLWVSVLYSLLVLTSSCMFGGRTFSLSK